MKISPNAAIYRKIEAATQCVIHACKGPETLRDMYRNQTTTRLVWDVFWATNNSQTFYRELSTHSDNHIETMLIRICTQHGLVSE